jgi:hypothetical protein
MRITLFAAFMVLMGACAPCKNPYPFTYGCSYEGPTSWPGEVTPSGNGLIFVQPMGTGWVIYD